MDGSRLFRILTALFWLAVLALVAIDTASTRARLSYRLACVVPATVCVAIVLWAASRDNDDYCGTVGECLGLSFNDLPTSRACWAELTCPNIRSRLLELDEDDMRRRATDVLAVMLLSREPADRSRRQLHLAGTVLSHQTASDGGCR